MPSFGGNGRRFDVDNTPSNAGVLSEVFRTRYPSKRSFCTHFPLSMIGNKAEELALLQYNSRTGFDEFGAYYNLSVLPNTKILFLGLGKRPSEITSRHLMEYRNKDCKDYFHEEYEAKLIYRDKGKQIEETRTMVNRTSGRDNLKSIHGIYDKLYSYKCCKISNLDVVCISAVEANEVIKSMLEKGIRFSH